MRPTDLDLMAYADGELDDAAALEIEEAIKADPALADIIAKLQASRALAQAAFEDVEAAPMSQGLAALIGEIETPHAEIGQPQGREPTDPVIVPMPTRSRGGAAALTWPQTIWPALVAACAAMGLLAGYVLPGRSGPDTFLQLADNGSAEPGHLLVKALDTLPSGDDTRRVLIEASFEAGDGSLCRQFRLEQQTGIACREDASWRLVILAEASSPDRFQAAGGGDPVAVASAELGVTTRFNERQEAQLIEAGWTRKSD